MDLSRKSCRLCLSETEFNVSLFGSYSRRTNMVDKILVCLKVVIEESDSLSTICYKCAESVERYYDFIMFVKKSQTKFVNVEHNLNKSVSRRVVVREKVIDADYTFSFLETPEEKEKKHSSPFFSYFSPPNMLVKQPDNPTWKSPQTREDTKKNASQGENRLKRPNRTSRQHSRDLFESQSQDIEEDPRTIDWKLTPDDNILKRIRNKCFGRSDF